MLPMSRLLLLSAVVIAAGCASQAPMQTSATQPAQPSMTAGKHLVYRDANGMLVRQFDYPNEDFCRRVEAIAGRGARCQADSMGAQLQAKATMRYNPPGVMVEGHYADLARCQSDTRVMSAGVELVTACAPK